MQLADGPFSRLTGRWNFDALGERRLARALPDRFEFRAACWPPRSIPCSARLCDSIVDAFVQRAQSMYR